MPFDNERNDILFMIRLRLMHNRISPKAERNERVHTAQAASVLEHLERCGYRIVKCDEDRSQKPSILASEAPPYPISPWHCFSRSSIALDLPRSQSIETSSRSAI